MHRLTILGLALATAATFAAVATAAAPAHRHDMSTMSGTAASQKLAAELALGRLATAKYATNLALAKRNGYGVIAQMIPDIGWHFMNPKITTFDITKPPILVYGKRGSSWQLVAFEWVFPKKPAKAPLPGATYGSFGAACHTTRTGRSRSRRARSRAPRRARKRGRRSTSGTPIWSRCTSGRGLRIRAASSSGMNPLMRPFNGG